MATDEPRAPSATIVDSARSLPTDGPDGPPLERGDQVGRYVIIDRLGAGGMGVVYSAYDPELDRKVAVKLLRGDRQAGESRGRTRLLREAQALARVSHPNVVAVHDVGTHEGRVFLAMTFVRGPTLARWCAEQDRTWREVVDIYLDAAQGLMAVHRAGLVHRDFKPDNVMVDRGGRVQVMDFGLARSEEDVERSSGPRAPIDGLATPLTVTGALLGTPAYMAPEQHLGLPADARSDQFSFCVSLYEGLYGERPFKGSTVASLGLAISEGQVRDAPRGTRVPAWVRRVLMRGLSSRSDERWPSIEALCEALRDDPSRRYRRWAGVGAGIGTLGLFGWGLAMAMQPPPPPPPVCAGAGEALAAVWGPARMASIDAAFEGSGLPFASDAARSVRRSLDAWGGAWTRMHREACEATRLHGTQSERVLDRRMACLQGRLDDAATVLDQLESGGAEAVEGAVQAVSALPAVGPCGDLEALERGLEPPEDPDTRDVVSSVRGTLRQARATRLAGSPARALERARDAVGRASASGYRPVLAEAELELGQAALEAADYPEAERALEHAYFIGLEEGHLEVAAEAAAELIYVVGYRRQEPERGLRWMPHAEAVARRADPDGRIEALALHRSGAVLDGKGANDEAEARYRRALEIRERIHPGDHPDTASTLNNLGNIFLDRGEYEAAEAYYRRALEMREALFGASHPEVAGSLNNLSLTRRRQGDHAGAAALLARAVRIYEGAYGDHADTAQAQTNLASTLAQLGELERAEAMARDALRMRQKVLGPEHPDLGDTELVLADLAAARGEHEASLELRQAALSHYRASFGVDHPAVFDARLAVARSQRALGRDDAASELLRTALDDAGAGVAPADLAAAQALLDP